MNNLESHKIRVADEISNKIQIFNEKILDNLLK